MTTDIAVLLAQKFIQRKDVKAIQVADGGYRPDRTPWKMGDLRAHVAGDRTFGHYLCDQESRVKLFVLDIDLEETKEGGYQGNWVERPDMTGPDSDKYFGSDGTDGNALFLADHVVHPASPRRDWRDPRHPGREWWKYQMRTLADMFVTRIRQDLGLPCAAAYSGNKGLHVYGFTGECSAADARMLAMAAMELAAGTFSVGGEFVATRGTNFYKYFANSGSAKTDAIDGFENLSIEIFPKQDTMDGKDLGNLVRLPMGVNQKSGRAKSGGGMKYDPAFFLNQLTPVTDFTPHPNPVALLEEGDPFKRYET